MTTPNEQNYQPLGPDEVIQEGDAYTTSASRLWLRCISSIGDTPKEWPEFVFRRPIPAEPIVKEEALGGSEPIAIGGTSYCETCRNQIFPDDCCTCPSPSAPFGKCSSCGQPLNSNQVCDLCFPAEPEPKGEEKPSMEQTDYVLTQGQIIHSLRAQLEVSKALLAAVESERDQLRTRAETAERERDENFDAHDRGSYEFMLCGVLKTTIEAHGPITSQNISSAAKRLVGQINAWRNDEVKRLSKLANDNGASWIKLQGEIAEMWKQKEADKLEIDRLQAELAKCREALKPLDAIAERLATQDNRITAHPMFCVQIKVRDIGYDASYCDSKCWHDSANCETIYDDDKDFQEPSGKEWDEFGYRDRWETVMVAFTEKGCEDYLSIDGHNVRHRAFRGEVRIYAESYNRCWEMIEIREALLRQAKAALEGGK